MYIYYIYIYITLIVHETLKDCPLHQSLMDVLVLRHSQISVIRLRHTDRQPTNILSLNKLYRYAHSSIIYMYIHMIYVVGMI